MRKTCLFIIGGNLTGKSTLARALAEHYDGIESVTPLVTYCRGNCCLAGKYLSNSQYGGVDSLNTSQLAEAVIEGLKSKDLIIAEGSYMDTFGLNMTNAMFNAENHLVVHLYCDIKTLIKRQVERSKNHGSIKSIVKRCNRVQNVAKKWASVGVNVLQYNTAETPVEVIVDNIIQLIKL